MCEALSKSALTALAGEALEDIGKNVDTVTKRYLFLFAKSSRQLCNIDSVVFVRIQSVDDHGNLSR